MKAAEIAARAAMHSGFEAKKSEVHGMAQRGGSVESHVRFGASVFSPLIPEGKAHFLVPFDAAEAERLRGYLDKKGRNFVSDLAEARAHLSDARYLNVFLLGRLSRFLPLKEETWLTAMKEVFAPEIFEQNKKIFYLGRGEAQ